MPLHRTAVTPPSIEDHRQNQGLLSRNSNSTRANQTRKVFAWGQNREGQLSVRVSDSLDQFVNKPTVVVGLTGKENWPVALASGNTHSVAVT